MFIDLPIDTCRDVLQFIELTDIVRFKMAFGKALEGRIQEVIEEMVHTPSVAVRSSNYLSKTWYVEHLLWAMNNNIYFHDVGVSFNDKSLPSQEFLRNFISHTGEYIEKLELSEIGPNSIDYVRELLPCMPNVTCLKLRFIGDLPYIDIIELFGNLPLTSLEVWNSSKKYKASQVFSTWPSLDFISMPLVYDPEMSPSLGQTVKSLNIDHCNWDLVKYFPNLERISQNFDSAVSEAYIKDIASCCPHIQSLTTSLKTEQYHYLSHLVDCQQLRTLIVGHRLLSAVIDLGERLRRNGTKTYSDILPLPQVTGLSCDYNPKLLNACPNLTKLSVFKVDQPNYLIDGMLHLVHLTCLNLHISADYVGSSWSESMKLLLTNCPRLQSLVCIVEGTIGFDRDLLGDIIGVGHQELREVRISCDDEGMEEEDGFFQIIQTLQSKSNQLHHSDVQTVQHASSDVGSEPIVAIIPNMAQVDSEEGVASEVLNNCPKLTHIDVVAYLRESSYSQLARCPDLKKLYITSEEADIPRLLKSCPQVESLCLASVKDWKFFRYSHRNLKRLNISMRESYGGKPMSSTDQNVGCTVGNFPALEELSMYGGISFDEWISIVTSCKHSRIHRLEFSGKRCSSLFTDAFIESIMQSEAFSELKYFVWNDIHSKNKDHSVFIDALTSASKGRFSVVLSHTSSSDWEMVRGNTF